MLTLPGCQQVLWLLLLLLQGRLVPMPAVTAVLRPDCCMCAAAGACDNALQEADCS
jgi:hypothetical protein